MADAMDQVTDREQAIADAKLAQRQRYVGVSAFECEGCGSIIPEARRLAVPGCTECAYCKAAGERRKEHGLRNF